MDGWQCDTVLSLSSDVRALLTVTYLCTACLQDSVLAFWKHGLQGRCLQTSEVIFDVDDISA